MASTTAASKLEAAEEEASAEQEVEVQVESTVASAALVPWVAEQKMAFKSCGAAFELVSCRRLTYGRSLTLRSHHGFKIDSHDSRLRNFQGHRFPTKHSQVPRRQV